MLKLKIPPVLILIFLGGLMLAVERLPMMGHFDFPGRPWVAVIFVMVGIILVGSGVNSFRAADTTVDPLHPDRSSALVTTGLYALSRNPMYLGMAMILAGWSFFLGAWAAFLALPLFVLYMNRFQIAGEEKFLEERFGKAFRDYRARVRRWI